MTEAVAERVAQNLVTSENLAAFNDERMRITPEKPAPKEEPKTEPAKAADAPAPEAEEEETPAKADAKPDAKPVEKKGALKERMSELAQARKEAEAKAAAAEKRATDAEAARVAAEAKLVPPKPAETGAEPQRSQFQDDAEYIKALTDHRVEAALAARDKKAAEEAEARAQTARAKTWDEAMAATEAEIPDLREKLEASPIELTRELAQAVLDTGKIGPKILLYFAENKAEAERIKSLNVGQMLREVGKLEARMEAAPAKKDAEPVAATTREVEISKAPPPISPIKANGGGVPDPVDSKGEFHGTYAQYKAARQAGKIK